MQSLLRFLGFSRQETILNVSSRDLVARIYYEASGVDFDGYDSDPGEEINIDCEGEVWVLVTLKEDDWSRRDHIALHRAFELMFSRFAKSYSEEMGDGGLESIRVFNSLFIHCREINTASPTTVFDLDLRGIATPFDDHTEGEPTPYNCRHYPHYLSTYH